MTKIGILYICTGKYKVFWPGFYETAEKYFLPDCEKHYFIFTDADTLEYTEGNSRVHMTKQEAVQWPFATLLRYEIFLQREVDLKNYDYLFFFNADAEFVKTVTREMFLPRREYGEDLLVVQHAGYYETPPYEFTYDRNPLCRAFIPYGVGKIYVCGGVNGGTSEGYLRMCRILAKRIRADLDRGIIALWHDESHLNKYILRYKHYRLLSPSFVHPTQDWWQIPYESIIQIRDKAKYFDVGSFKTNTPEIKQNKVENLYNRIALRIIRELKRMQILK